MLNWLKRRYKSLDFCISIGRERYDGIYHYHIQKTGGTSINHAFCALAYEEGRYEVADGDKHDAKGAVNLPGLRVYQLANRSRDGLVEGNGRRIVCFNRESIERNTWFYAHSHEAFQDIKIPDKAFKITCIRDPIARVRSRYLHLKHLQEAGRLSSDDIKWGSVLDEGIDSFIEHYPKHLLNHQLYMFSKSFNVKEAKNNLRQCNFILQQEYLTEDLALLRDITGLELVVSHAKRRAVVVEIPQETRSRLKEILKDEYQFFEIAKELRLEKRHQLEKLAS